MATIAPSSGRARSAPEADDAGEDGFKPWSAEQVRQWRASHPPLSPGPVIGVQALVGLLAVGIAWWWAGAQRPSVTMSVAYGVLTAWVPALLFARLVARRMRTPPNAASALLAMMVGEGVKIVLTVALLLAAPRLLGQVHWLGLLAGFVVTIKAAWVALWLMSAQRRRAARLT